MSGQLVHLVDGDAEKSSHLIYECARSAGAGAVHSLFYAAREKYELGILAAQLYNTVCIGIILLYGYECTVYLLHKGESCRIGKTETRRTRDGGLEFCIGELFPDLLYLFSSGLAHL